MKDSPKDQCKCIILYENFMNMLKGLSVTYDSSKFWHMFLCDSSLNSSYLQSNCEVCKNGKTLALGIDPETNVSWKEWCLVEVGQNTKKLQCQVGKGCAGELTEILKNQWLSALTHINIKLFRAVSFKLIWQTQMFVYCKSISQ